MLFLAVIFESENAIFLFICDLDNILLMSSC